MNDSEKDLLIQIAQTTAQTEERARNIENDVQELKERYGTESQKRDKRLDTVEKQVDRHDVILSGGLAAFVAGTSAFFGWLFGLIKL